jgi:hypothetical protein
MQQVEQFDSRGRATYIVEWVDTQGIYRPEPYTDGQPVGYRRGQVFRVTKQRIKEIFNNPKETGR